MTGMVQSTVVPYLEHSMNLLIPTFSPEIRRARTAGKWAIVDN